MNHIYRRVGRHIYCIRRTKRFMAPCGKKPQWPLTKAWLALGGKSGPWHLARLDVPNGLRRRMIRKNSNWLDLDWCQSWQEAVRLAQAYERHAEYRDLHGGDEDYIDRRWDKPSRQKPQPPSAFRGLGP